MLCVRVLKGVIVMMDVTKEAGRYLIRAANVW